MGKRGLALLLVLMMSLNLLSLTALASENEELEVTEQVTGGTIDEPVADEPTVDEPTTDEPTTDEPTTDEPATDEPAVDEPATDEPAVDEPTTDEPAVDEPTTDEPATDEPAANEPTTDEPTVDEPTTDEPAANEPTTDEPKVDEPTTDEPTADEPAADEPAADEPAADEPESDALPPDNAQEEGAAEEEQAAQELTKLAVVELEDGDYEYVLDTDGVDSGAIYAIYTNVEGNTNNRILYHSGTGKTDKVQSKDPNTDLTDNKLPLNSSFDASRQLWVIAEAGNGYTVRSVDSGRYLDLSETSVKNINTSADAVTLQIEQAEDGTYTIRQDGAYALAYNSDNIGGQGLGNIYAGEEAASLRFFKRTEVQTETTPPRTLDDAIADDTTDVHYLTGIPTGGNGWVGSVNERKTVELLAPAVTEGITTGTSIALTGSITSGNQYIIRGANFTNNGKCDMHISAPNTNQCGAGSTNTVKCMEHLFTFTVQEDGTYKISNGSNYLTTKTTTVNTRPHFLFDATGSNYGVTPVEGQEGSYYIWWETEAEPEFDGYTPEQAIEDGKTVQYLAFTGGTSNSRYWDVSGTAGDTTKIQLYTASGADSSSTTTLATGGITAGNYVINFDTGNTGRQAVMHYSDPATNQCSSVSVTCGNNVPAHLFVFTQSGDETNGFTISPYSAPTKYLSLEASGNNRLFKDEATTFYINPTDTEGAYYIWTALEPEDYSNLESAQTEFRGKTDGEPFSTDDVGTQMYRIPAMITLDNGWIVAAADVRWAGWNDTPANLDTIVSVSRDNGATWDWEVINYFGDHANTVQGKPLSAAFIDPILVQDPATEKVWMAIDVTAADGKSTGGSTGFDSQNRILVAHAPGCVGVKAPGNTSLYTYYVDNEPASVTFEGKTLYAIKASANDAESGYAVDAFMNLYNVDGDTVTQEWCKQEGSELKVQTNLFYKQSAWKVFPTCFIMLRSAEVTDDGLVWDDPIFPNTRYAGQTQPFYGVCPGRGTVTENGRIIFPMYDNATGNELASVIYSDDGGETWERGSRSNLVAGGKTSESQIITLPDGTLRMYSRNSIERITYADSTDDGKTWGPTQQDDALVYGSNCMFSVINVTGTLKSPNGDSYENVVMISYPKGTGSYPGGTWDANRRSNGSLRIGYIGEDNVVTWLGEQPYTYKEGRFCYSCLTQFGAKGSEQDRFAVIYEPNDNSGYAGDVDILYKEFTVAEVLGEGWTLTQDEEPTPESIRVTDAGDKDIVAEDGVYTIPAGGMVYMNDVLTFTVPMGVKELRVPAGKAGELALGETDGEVAAIEGMSVVMPNGEEAEELIGSGQCGDDVYYALVKDASSTAKTTYTRMHISGTGPMWDMYTSPSYADIYPNGHLRPYQSLASNIKWAKVYDGVTTIGDCAFYNTSSGSGRLSDGIELPTTLTTIGRDAFRYVKMPEITIPEGVTSIGVCAFYGAGQAYKKGFGGNPDTPAKFVPELPSTLTELGESAFAFSNLTEITVPEGVKVIPQMAFYACERLNKVTILGATEIGVKAFGASGTYSTGTIEFSLPETLTTIHERAFNNAKVRSLTIPASVTDINGTNVFGSQLGNLRFLGTPTISADAFKETLSKQMVVYVADIQALEQLRDSLATINGTYYVANLNGHDTTLSTLYTGYLFEPVKDGVASFWYDEEGNMVETGKYYTPIPAGNDSGAVFTAGKVSHTVTFEPDGGTLNGGATVTVDHGEAVGSLPTADREGHTFGGWFMGETEVTPETVVNGDMTVTAKWTVNTYTVTYVIDGETVNTAEYAYGSEVAPFAAPDKAGHTFAGWTNEPKTMPAEDVTVTGSYTANSYTVTVDGKEYTVNYGDTLIGVLPEENPTREGHTFGGWFAGETKVTAETVVNGNMTVTAKWTVNTYTVTYVIDGETVKTAEYAYGSTVEPFTAPDKAGHSFAGWTGEPETMPAGDVTVTGSYTANSCTVTIDGEAYTIDYGGKLGDILPANPTKEGHVFSGWFSNGVKVDSETVVTGDMTVESGWDINTYTVTVDGQAHEIEHGSTLAGLLTGEPTREGYTFKGWTDAQGNEVTAETQVNGDMTITTQWEQNTYTVTVGEQTITVKHGESLGENMPVNPRRSGYAFRGWFTSDRGGEQITAETPITASLTLYARWTYVGSDTYDDPTPTPTPPTVEIEDPEVPLAELPLPFEDVKDGDWYREAVAYVWSNNFMRGTSDNLFGVETNTTRGMMAMIFYRMEKEPDVIFEKLFDDVDDGKWFSEAITWANANGVAVGFDNGSFRPDDNVTREQLVAMLYRYAVKNGFDVSKRADLSVFADADKVSGYAVEAMSWAVSEGIIVGRGADSLAPDSPVLRVEGAAIFQRFAELYINPKTTA